MAPKKSQIQIGETIAVLFIFFILIMIGLIFYTQFVKSDLESKSEKSSEIKSVEIAQRAMFLPELECGRACISQRSNCIDELKLKEAQNIIRSGENEKFYYDLFEFSEINITSIYPIKSSWTIYSKKNNAFEKSYTTYVPIALCDPRTRRYGFGIMTIKSQLR